MLSELLTAPAQLLLDRGVDKSSTARALCTRLEGRVLQVDAGSAGLSAWFSVSNVRLEIHPGYAETADARLSGTPLNLARLSGSDPEGLIRAGAVRITGDADIATDFRALLNIIRPDWEDELSTVTGDAGAHAAGRLLRGAAGWAERARHSLGRSLAEYLTEERRDLIARTELEEFCSGVDQVAAGVDRFEARLKALHSQMVSD